MPVKPLLYLSAPGRRSVLWDICCVERQVSPLMSEGPGPARNKLSNATPASVCGALPLNKVVGLGSKLA